MGMKNEIEIASLHVDCGCLKAYVIPGDPILRWRYVSWNGKGDVELTRDDAEMLIKMEQVSAAQSAAQGSSS